ncbi:MAG: 4Fe-4S dicluster domain-containing protein [Alphaproteobacteria bacterium]|nr:4Fe-4S dicluster domain-containing protein [Alphaproteobacteria bacterium]
MPDMDAKVSGAAVVLGVDGLDALVGLLVAGGYRTIGPRVEEGAVVYGPVRGVADLPAGYVDEQAPGSYRLTRKKDGKALFDWTVGPHSWKRYLYPPEQLLFRAERRGGGFSVLPAAEEESPLAFIGVRPCELAAIAVHDRVFSGSGVVDPGYAGRRDGAFLVAVNCTRAGGTCFCPATGTGPRARTGFDLALTEIEDGKRHLFVVETGSERGAALLARLKAPPADGALLATVTRLTRKAAKAMVRDVPKDTPQVLKRNLDSPRWDDVAARCLGCANCTLVCPTCFCATVEDTTDLSGGVAERWRRWDSCFTSDFSYIHGGVIRREIRSRYRQWLTHKLATWSDQFGVGGCTGCGRCITWCPVGIDITEEARAIRAGEGRAGEGRR